MFKKIIKVILFLILISPWINAIMPANAGGVIRSILHEVRARGKCRNIIAERNVVKVYFINNDDAKIFAKDLSALINEE